ncbi:MAG TPA: FkbM family methyltransferase [Gaiellaceae bacterium]|nr:FkbM family methyltransferase [Gaiellaceae bacterium]
MQERGDPNEGSRDGGRSLSERARAGAARFAGHHLGARGTERLVRMLYDPDRRRHSFTSGIFELRDGSRMALDTRSFVEWQLFVHGRYEPHLQREYLAVLRAGDCAIDVGANVGAHTVPLARAVSPGTVVAVEPFAGVVERLRRNIALNELSDVVRIVEKAALERSGTTTFYPPREEAANQAQGSASSFAHLRHDGISIPATSLDDLVTELGLGRVAFVKIEAQGWEHEVLLGAAALLERDRPTVAFRYDLGILAQVAEHRPWPPPLPEGYRLFELSGRGRVELAGAPKRSCVILCKPPEA